MSTRHTHSFEALETRCQLSADLTAAILSPAAGAALAFGPEQRAAITVTNSGDTGLSDRVGLRLFASVDDTLDASDTLLGSRTVSNLSAGESESEDIEFALPVSLAPGAYRLLAQVDPENMVAESNEANNTSAPVAVTLGGGGGGTGGDDNPGDGSGGGAGDSGGTGGDNSPGDGNGGGGAGGGAVPVELTASMIAPSTPLIPNTQARVSVRVENSGNTRVRDVGVQVFVMRGDTPDSSTDALLGQRRFSTLSGGEAETEDIEFVVRGDLAGATRKLYAVVDPLNRIAESNETNNISSPVDAVFTASTIDLSGTINRSRLPEQIVQGERLSSSVSYTLSNSGNQPFSSRDRAGVRAFLRPADAQDDSRDVAVSSSKRESLSGLSSGRSRSRSLGVSIPAGIAPGEYRLVLILDDSGTHTESDEHNNTLIEDRLVRIAAPTIDLSLAATTTLTGAPQSGQTARASVTITNLGNSRAKGAAAVQFFMRDADGNEIAISALRSTRVDLKPGRTGSVARFSIALPVAVPAGAYSLIARLTTAMADADPSNNTRDLGPLTVG